MGDDQMPWINAAIGSSLAADWHINHCLLWMDRISTSSSRWNCFREWMGLGKKMYLDLVVVADGDPNCFITTTKEKDLVLLHIDWLLVWLDFLCFVCRINLASLPVHKKGKTACIYFGWHCVVFDLKFISSHFFKLQSLVKPNGSLLKNQS